MACARGCCDTQADHYRSLVFATTKTVDTRSFDADMDAYARLRRDGVQPPKIRGAAAREKHADTVEQAEGRPAGTPGWDADIKTLTEALP
jgi:hypothetical protein